MLAGKKRQVALLLAIALTVVVVAFVMFVARPATEPAPDAEPAMAEPAAAVAAPSDGTPVVDPAVEALPPSRQHVRKSNIKLLHPPEKKDFSKMSVPAQEAPKADE